MGTKMHEFEAFPWHLSEVLSFETLQILGCWCFLSRLNLCSGSMLLRMANTVAIGTTASLDIRPGTWTVIFWGCLAPSWVFMGSTCVKALFLPMKVLRFLRHTSFRKVVKHNDQTLSELLRCCAKLSLRIFQFVCNTSPYCQYCVWMPFKSIDVIGQLEMLEHFYHQNWVKGYRIWTIEIGVPRMLMNIPKWHDTPLMFQANQVGHHESICLGKRCGRQ